MPLRPLVSFLMNTYLFISRITTSSSNSNLSFLRANALYNNNKPSRLAMSSSSLAWCQLKQAYQKTSCQFYYEMCNL